MRRTVRQELIARGILPSSSQWEAAELFGDMDTLANEYPEPKPSPFPQWPLFYRPKHNHREH